MSSAILYLAMIAVWAGFLFPAWVRRPHVRSGELDESDLSYGPGGLEFGERTETLAETKNDAEPGATVAHAQITEYLPDDYQYCELEDREEEY